MNPKQDQPKGIKELRPKYIPVKLLENKSKEKYLKISKRETTPETKGGKRMPLGFSSETTEVSAQHFSSAERWNYEFRTLFPVKMCFGNVGEIKAFSGEGTKRICHQHTNPKRMAD